VVLLLRKRLGAVPSILSRLFVSGEDRILIHSGGRSSPKVNTSPCGEIGRHARLRALWPLGRAGSIPVMDIEVGNTDLLPWR
jgi:hypothetical protein